MTASFPLRGARDDEGIEVCLADAPAGFIAAEPDSAQAAVSEPTPNRLGIEAEAVGGLRDGERDLLQTPMNHLSDAIYKDNATHFLRLKPPAAPILWYRGHERGAGGARAEAASMPSPPSPQHRRGHLRPALGKAA